MSVNIREGRMSERPFISIIIPTRDRPKLVAQVLKFLQIQTFTNFEVIVSDNGLNDYCENEVLPYLADNRFSYKRPPVPMNMCDHWDFAVEGALGEYITVFCEKFILRPDALSILYDISMQTDADILTWQYDIFADATFVDNQLTGNYHPYIKPADYIEYSASDMLQRYFSLDIPLFSRGDGNRNSYGKIYSGCVKASMLSKVKKKYGRAFYPTSPDYTSMFALLNESKMCIDVSQSLMLLIALKGASNGEATQSSLIKAREYLQDYCSDFNSFINTLPIKGCWVGPHIHIASDLLAMQEIATDGPIKHFSLDLVALAFWAKNDVQKVEEWGDVDKNSQLNKLDDILSNPQNRSRLRFLKEQLIAMEKPCINEIYHCGLHKIDKFDVNTSANDLAKLHWMERVAPPRKNICGEKVSLDYAVQYFFEYNTKSYELLNSDIKDLQ